MTNKNRAFTGFVEQHQASLRAYVRVIGVAASSVDDIAQEAFLVAFRELERFDSDEDFGKWLRGIARNIVRNEMRKNARQSRIMNHSLTEHLISEAESASKVTSFEDKEFAALRDCLESLPKKSRQMISMRYVDEWNASVLADQFGMTATAVRLALMRVRAKLKVCMDQRLDYS